MLVSGKEEYDLYRSYIEPQNFDTNISKIIKLVDRMYERGSSNISCEEIKLLFKSEYPSMKEDVLRLIFDTLDTIYALNVSKEIHNEIIQNFKNKITASKLGELSLKYIDNPHEFDIEELKLIVDKYEASFIEEEDSTLVEIKLEDLLSTESDESGIGWPWEDVTTYAGKMKGGSLTLLIATPETGKTNFCLTAGTHFVQHTKVLHLNNEERDSKVMMRAWECWCEMSKKEITFNPEEAKNRWGVIKDNWILRDAVGLTIPQLKKYIEKDKPNIIIIDQATKIKIKESGRHDLTLTEIFKELREIAKEGIDIVCVSQAEAGAYNTQWLEMHHVANSKVGVQGELDTLIGLVRQPDSTFVNVSFPKAKETGGSGGRTVLELKKEISRMVEVE